MHLSQNSAPHPTLAPKESLLVCYLPLFQTSTTVKIVIDQRESGEVCSGTEKYRLFSNVTTVLPLLGLVGSHTQLFRVGGTNPRPFSDPQNLGNGETAA